MKGKYFCVYDLKNDEQCVGVFESVEGIFNFFRITNKNRIHESVHRKMPLAFKSKRYEVVPFAIPTMKEVKRKLREVYGMGHFEIRSNGEVYVRYDGTNGWKLLAENQGETEGWMAWAEESGDVTELVEELLFA